MNYDDLKVRQDQNQPDISQMKTNWVKKNVQRQQMYLENPKYVNYQGKL